MPNDNDVTHKVTKAITHIVDLKLAKERPGPYDDVVIVKIDGYAVELFEGEYRQLTNCLLEAGKKINH